MYCYSLTLVQSVFLFSINDKHHLRCPHDLQDFLTHSILVQYEHYFSSANCRFCSASSTRFRSASFLDHLVLIFPGDTVNRSREEVVSVSYIESFQILKGKVAWIQR